LPIHPSYLVADFAAREVRTALEAAGLLVLAYESDHEALALLARGSGNNVQLSDGALLTLRDAFERTGVVVVIPLLFMGSLITESFFGIPGLGSYTIDAIQAQDFAGVRAMVFIGSVLYIVGLLLTDISYTIVDPRVRLN
jgi:hypothetical protein